MIKQTGKVFKIKASKGLFLPGNFYCCKCVYNDEDTVMFIYKSDGCISVSIAIDYNGQRQEEFRTEWEFIDGDSKGIDDIQKYINNFIKEISIKDYDVISTDYWYRFL